MRTTFRLSILFCLLLASSVPARSDSQKAAEGAAPIDLQEWCRGYFPSQDEERATVSRPTEKLAPFKLADMISPTDLITETEITGKLPGYIRKYRGVWIWPMTSEPPPFAVFVERLGPKEMTIAHLSRATEDNKAYRQRLLENSRKKLTWTGGFFSTEPEGELQSTTSIHISAFGHAMLLVHENKREAWPFCFISSKHY